MIILRNFEMRGNCYEWAALAVVDGNTHWYIKGRASGAKRKNYCKHMLHNRMLH